MSDNPTPGTIVLRRGAARAVYGHSGLTRALQDIRPVIAAFNDDVELTLRERDGSPFNVRSSDVCFYEADGGNA
ncbi:MAG: hypothetical protein ACLP1Q_21260 [Solirubrobacteraceae bacterium]